MTLGVETAKLFEQELGIKILKNKPEREAFIAVSDKIGTIRSPLASLELMPGSIRTSNFYNTCDFRDEGKEIASSRNKSGKGQVAGVYFNAGTAYSDYKSPVLRDFIKDQITELFPNPLVKVSGSSLVHVTVNRLNEKVYVNLMNAAGEHTNPKAIGYDEIPALKNLTVQINTVKKPSRILLQPQNQELKFDFHCGVAQVLVTELGIHSILEIIP